MFIIPHSLIQKNLPVKHNLCENGKPPYFSDTLKSMLFGNRAYVKLFVFAFSEQVLKFSYVNDQSVINSKKFSALVGPTPGPATEWIVLRYRYIQDCKLPDPYVLE